MKNNEYSDTVIDGMRKVLKDSTELENNPIWVSFIKEMFFQDCNSRDTCEFLLEKSDKKIQNVQKIAMLLLSALLDILDEKKTLLIAPTIVVRDIATTIENNFEDYEVAVSFFSKIDGAIEFSIIAQK